MCLKNKQTKKNCWGGSEPLLAHASRQQRRRVRAMRKFQKQKPFWHCTDYSARGILKIPTEVWGVIGQRGPAVSHRELDREFYNHLDGKESEREWMCVHVEQNQFVVQQKLPQHCKSTRLHWNFKKKKKEKSDAKSIQYLNRKVHLNIKILKQETFGKIINSIRLKYS